MLKSISTSDCDHKEKRLRRVINLDIAVKIVYRNRKSYRGGCEYENWQNICGFAPRMCVCKVFCGIKIMVLIKSLLGGIHGAVLELVSLDTNSRLCSS